MSRLPLSYPTERIQDITPDEKLLWALSKHLKPCTARWRKLIRLLVECKTETSQKLCDEIVIRLTISHRFGIQLREKNSHQGTDNDVILFLTKLRQDEDISPQVPLSDECKKRYNLWIQGDKKEFVDQVIAFYQNNKNILHDEDLLWAPSKRLKPGTPQLKNLNCLLGFY